MPPGAGPVFCPDCGAKNKAGWEFCARCGASLQGAGKVKRDAVPPTQPEPIGPTAASLLGWIAVAGFAVAAFFFLRGQAGPAPTSDIFAVPTPPPKPPAVTDAPEPGGVVPRNARARLARGDVAGALAELAEAVGQDPQDHALRALYAKALWQAGERDRALEQFRTAAAGDRTIARDYADALLAAERPAEAAEQYRIAVESSPGDDRALRSLGQALLQVKRPAEAIEPLRRAVELRPDIMTSQQLATALEETGDSQAAVEVYRDILGRMPGATTSRGRLAELLQAQGRNDEALQLLQEGLQASPDSPALQRSLGSLLDRAGRRDEAVAAFQAFLRLAPNDPVAPLVQKRLGELLQRPTQAS